jgi:hypothetical protein
MDQQSKESHSKRIHQKEVVQKRKAKIAKAHGIVVENPHELLDHSPVSCSSPLCVMCRNPRKTFKELTIQEQREFQNLDEPRGKRSNGNLTTTGDESHP